MHEKAWLFYSQAKVRSDRFLHLRKDAVPFNVSFPLQYCFRQGTAGG
jgi:hypothetical protein